MIEPTVRLATAAGDIPAPTRRPGAPRHAPVRAARAPGPTNRPLRSSAVAIALYLLLAVVCYWDVWTGGLAHVAQAGGDQIQAMWQLNWLPFALGQGHSLFFTWFLNVPFGVNLLANTSFPLLGLIVSPVTVLFGPTASFNLLETLALAGSATSMYFVARRFTTWRPAAFVAGLLYGFSPYEMGQSLGHLNLTFCVLPPLILLLVHDIAVRHDGHSVRRGLLLAGLVVGQFFISTEILLTTALIGVVLVAVIAIRGRHQVVERFAAGLRGYGVALALAVPVLAYPAWLALAGPGHVNGVVQTVSVFRSDLLGPLIPDAVMRFDVVGARMASVVSGGPAENGSYLGWPLLVVLAVGTWCWRRLAVIQVAVVVGVVAFVLSLGSRLVVHGVPGPTPTGATNGSVPLPWAIVERLPGFNNVLPVRISLYVVMAAALLLGVVVDRIYRTRRAMSGAAAGAAVVGVISALVLVPLVPDVPFGGVTPVSLPAYFTSPDVERIPPGSVAATFPYPNGNTAQPELWQTAAGMRYAMLGGYDIVPTGPDRQVASSAVLPDALATTTATVLAELYRGTPVARTPAIRRVVRSELSSWHVQTFLAVPEPGSVRADLAYLTWLLGRAPVSQGGVYVWYRLHPG